MESSVTPNVPAMRVAAAQIEEMLDQAVAIVEEGTPQERDAALRMVDGYVRLAGAYLDRFDAAAHGA